MPPVKPTPASMPSTTSGPQHAVPCPHCGKTLNFRGQDELLAGGVTFKCDHCRNLVELVKIQDIKFITVRRPMSIRRR